MDQKLPKKVHLLKTQEAVTLLLLLFLLLLLSPITYYLSPITYLPAHAQFLPEPVSLNASPASPSPGDTVVIQAATPTFDRFGATFDWTVDGQPRPDLSGIGKDSITLRAGDVGSTLRVSAAVQSADGSTGSAALTIRVSDVVLTWFAETYIPAWYKGKALPTPDSIVSIVAVPRIVINGAAIPPENLVYRWGLDDRANALAGRGEQVFRIRMSDLPKTSHRVSALIEDINGAISREEEIVIIPVSAKALLYHSSPLGGIEPRAAAAVSFERGLVDFQAEPFFLPVSSRRDLSFEWRFAGAPVDGTPQNPWLITVDAGIQGSGTFPLSLTIRDVLRNTPGILAGLTLFLE